MAIGHYLRFEKLCFYKQNVRGYLKNGVFRKDRNPYVLTGLPDYVVLYRGFHQGLEVKTLKNRQTENQKEFQKYIEDKGGAFYAVVRSVEEVQKVVRTFRAFVDGLLLEKSQNV